MLRADCRRVALTDGETAASSAHPLLVRETGCHGRHDSARACCFVGADFGPLELVVNRGGLDLNRCQPNHRVAAVCKALTKCFTVPSVVQSKLEIVTKGSVPYFCIASEQTAK